MDFTFALEETGSRIKPSAAAQMSILRTKPGIIRYYELDIMGYCIVLLYCIWTYAIEVEGVDVLVDDVDLHLPTPASQPQHHT